ncbi:hypothetical protein, conserved [Eimeria praecox]|uniref:Tyrosine-protein kinase ephrin type A/B receptor-like domain-containing protein n=1 Tax=Eimeria praecox TaxID=51316 RepID=U6GX88_9EIME|nr:hypothetical protein, conserved [Eimeria praecox]
MGAPTALLAILVISAKKAVAASTLQKISQASVCPGHVGLTSSALRLHVESVVPLRYPQSLIGDGGVPCMPGYYCPEGSSSMIPCPVGTYNPDSAKGSPDDCLECPVGSFTNAMGQKSCIACGGSSFTEVGSFECKCLGANRVYQPSVGACVCKTGYEHVVSGKDVSDEDGSEPCSPKEYPVCTGSRVYTHTGSCQDTSQVCEDYCGPKGGKYKPESTLCECSGLSDADEICDEGCKERQKAISIENGNLVVTNQGASINATFSLATLGGRSDVLFGNLDCPAGSCPAVLYSVSPDGSTHGYFGVPDELLAVINDRLDLEAANVRAAVLDSSRQPQPMLLRAEAQVPSLESPVLCIMTGSSVLWILESGKEPVYPVHVRDSLYNTDTRFDAGEFNNLKTEMESGAPLVLFGHTFTSPGILVFATNRNSNRIVFIKVVDEEAHCGSMKAGLPYPATNEFIAALSLAFPENVRFGAPDWSTLFITFGIVLLIALCFLLLQYQLRTRYWTFAPPLQVEHDNDAKDEPQPTRPNIFQPSVLCCKGKAAHEPEVTQTFTDLDPRVFQAVYCKLLETMSMLREQLEHMGMQQDQLIELELDMAGPLRTSLFPILAEASEKKAWVEVEDAELSEKLLDMKSLMHLRKGAFEEAVRKAYEAMTDAESQTLEQANAPNLYASLESQAIEATIRQASAAFIQVAGLKPESFAAALGVEQTIATTQALRHLQAVDAATQTLKELTTKLNEQDPKAAEELLTTCSSRIKQRLEATVISEHMEICEMRRSIDAIIGGLIDQRNSAFTQQQCCRDSSLLNNLVEFSKAVASLQEDIYGHFCSARRRYEKALSTKRLTMLPAIQKQFAETAESIYKEFLQQQTDAEAVLQESMKSKTTELNASIMELVSRCRKELEETKRVDLADMTLERLLLESTQELILLEACR